MNNPFKILRLMVKYRRPDRVEDMQAVKDSFWLGRNYAALTFFGYIIVHSQEEADRINSRTTNNSSLKLHETIHLRQAQATHNSWLCFYLRYLWYTLRALPQNRHMRNAAYRLNPFEMEAYAHDHDPNYLKQCTNGAQGWREYAKMSPRQRREMSKS